MTTSTALDRQVTEEQERPEESAPAKPDTEAKTTTYIVLRQLGDKGWSVENGSVPAANAEAAIRLACKTIDPPAGTYVAVPARSWKPIVVKTEVQTLLKLEDA